MTLLKDTKMEERILDRKNPGNSTIEITVAGDTRQTGKSWITHRIAKLMSDMGYGNVHVTSFVGKGSFDNPPGFDQQIHYDVKAGIRVDVQEAPTAAQSSMLRFKSETSPVIAKPLTVCQLDFELRRLAETSSDNAAIFRQAAAMIRNLPDIPKHVSFDNLPNNQGTFYGAMEDGSFIRMADTFSTTWWNRRFEFPTIPPGLDLRTFKD